MTRPERNRVRTLSDGMWPGEMVHGDGNGRADLDLKSGSDWIRSPSSSEDDDQAMTCLVRRMYRDMAEEPLPETFNGLIQRLRGANNNGSGTGSHTGRRKG